MTTTPASWSAAAPVDGRWCTRCKVHRIEGTERTCPSCDDDVVERLLTAIRRNERAQPR